MARVTVEDCIDKVDNRFGFREGDLVIAAEQGRDCTLAQVSGVPGTPGQSDNVIHNSGNYTNTQGANVPTQYNRPGGLPPPNDISYSAWNPATNTGGRLYNLGPAPTVVTYALRNSQLVAINGLTPGIPGATAVLADAYYSRARATVAGSDFEAGRRDYAAAVAAAKQVKSAELPTYQLGYVETALAHARTRLVADRRGEAEVALGRRFHEVFFLDSAPARAQVAILHSQDNVAVVDGQANTSFLHRALMGVYNALWYKGFAIDFVAPQFIGGPTAGCQLRSPARPTNP